MKRPLPQRLPIEFLWPVWNAGYRCVGTGSDAIIEQQHGAKTFSNRRPLENPVLFREFAALDGSPQACAGFASKYGLLGFGLPDQLWEEDDPTTLIAEPLSVWKSAIKGMRDTIAYWSGAPSQGGAEKRVVARSAKQPIRVSELVGELRHDRGAVRPVFRLTPRTLNDAIELQHALAVALNQRTRACDLCGTYFEQRGRGRAAHARFCSDKCRSTFHNQARREA